MPSTSRGRARGSGGMIQYQGRAAVLRFASDPGLVEEYSNLLDRSERKRVKEINRNAARSKAQALWIRLAKSFELRLGRGEIVASGYAEPVNVQAGRIEIPQEDWEFLQLDHWCNAAVERKRAYTWRESTTLDVEFSFYKDMEPSWSMEVIRSEPPPSRAVVSWLMFSELAPGQRATQRVNATIKLERDLAEFFRSERADGAIVPTKAEMKRRAERRLKRRIPQTLFTRVWAIEADPEWRKPGRRPQVRR